MKITKDELLRCKRATVCLAEVYKELVGGKQAPLEMRKDMKALTDVLRRLEAMAE